MSREYNFHIIQTTNKPLISIIIPVYNGEAYIKDCIDSCLNQTYTNIEIICINDGSTDNSLNTLQDYQSKYPNVKVISQENKGVASARNTGINNMNGDYVKWLDVDDILYQNCIEEFVNSSKKLNNNTILFCDYDSIDLDSNIIKYGKLKSKILNINNLDDKTIKSLLLYDFFIGGGLTFIHKSAFKHCMFNEEFLVNEDYDLILKLYFLYGFKIHLVQKSLLKGRHNEYNPNSLTNSNISYVSEIQQSLFKRLNGKELEYYVNFQPDESSVRAKFRQFYIKTMISILGSKRTSDVLNFYILKIRHKEMLFD